MEVEFEKKENDVTVINIKGRLDANTAPELQREITQIVNQGAHQLVMKFSELAYISSAGLRILITTVKMLKSKQGKLVLCDMQEGIYDVLKISGFTSIFNIQDDEQSALAQF